MSEKKTKSELISGLHDSNQRVANWFTEIQTKDFFTRQAEVWSASDNIGHLIEVTGSFLDPNDIWMCCQSLHGCRSNVDSATAENRVDNDR